MDQITKLHKLFKSEINGFEVGSTFNLSYEDYLRFSYTYIDTDSSDDDFVNSKPQHKANLNIILLLMKNYP